jgi:hypothetical protein
LYLEEATVMYSAGTFNQEWVADRELTLLTNDGQKLQVPELPGGSEWCSAFTAELQAAVDSIRDGVSNPLLSGTLARDALKLCYAEAESIASGGLVQI